MYPPALTYRKSVLAVAAACTPILLMPALAFGQAADSAAKIERVEITGSSIKRIDAETALPVQILKREDIERMGATSTEDLVKQISAFSSAGQVTTAASAGTQTGSISAVSLRGLGSARTLVLINGRRVSVYGGGSGGLAGAAVDVNSIPLAAIERVEILKDGASAVYGSDAIAGVVNFILRKDFKGVELSGTYGVPTKNQKGAQKKASVFAGFGNLAVEGYNVTLGASVQRVQPIFGADRDYARRINVDQGNDNLSNITFPANVLIPKTGALKTPDLTKCGPVSQVSPYSPTRCSFDNSPYVSIVPGSESFNLLANGRFALGADHEAYFESGYSQTKTQTFIQPVPLAYNNNLTATNPYNAFFANLIATQYPSLNTAPFTKTFGAQYPGAFLLPPSSIYYPQAFAAANGLSGQPLILNYRDDANGRRNQIDQSDATRLVAGIKGTLDGWDYDTGVLYSQSKVKEDLLSGYPQYSKLLPLLDSGVINPFGPTADQNALAAARAAEFVGTVYRSKTSVASVSGKASREIGALPAGMASMAVGAEFRQEKFQYDPSLAVQQGDIAGQGGNQLPETAQRHVTSAYVEFGIPIMAKLDGDIAVRYDNYQNVGSTVNPKLSLRYQPTNALLLRTAVGSGFRAPSLTDLYAAQASSVTPNGTRDPVRCPDIKTGLSTDCNNQFATLTGGNPNLKPEKSLSYTFGILFEPTRDLSLGLDAFRINLKDQIVGGGLSAAYILSTAARATQYAAYIQRGPADPANASGLGPITGILQTNANLFKTQLSGVDVEGKYGLKIAPGQKVTLRLSGTFLNKYDVQGPDGTYTSSLNRALTAGGGVLVRWKHNASATYETGPFSASLAQNFQQSYQDAPANRTGAPHVVDAYQTFDGLVGYSGIPSLKLVAGVKNLTNRTPPYANYAATTGQFVGGYDISYADVRGRFAYVTATYTFK